MGRSNGRPLKRTANKRHFLGTWLELLDQGRRDGGGKRPEFYTDDDPQRRYTIIMSSLFIVEIARSLCSLVANSVNYSS